MIKLQKVNETFLKIQSDDDGIYHELSDQYTFYVPGYKFMPSYKERMWDGKIRLYDRRTNQIYVGLLDSIKDWAENSDYSIEYVGNHQFDKKTEINDDFVKNLKITSNSQIIKPHPFQLKGFKEALEDKRKIIISPTGSGKSLIIYMMIRYYLEYLGESVLLIVPQTSLVEQMYTDFIDYSSLDDSFDVEKICHKIYSGKEKFDYHGSVVISTWQSIYKLSTSWFDKFGFVIGDEVHTFKATCLKSIMEKAINAEYRVGLSGTLDDTIVHELVLTGLFGPITEITTTAQEMAAGRLANLNIFSLVLKYTEEEKQATKKFDYQKEIDFLITHPRRNKFIKNLALDLKGNTLVMFSFVNKHGMVLYDLINRPDRHVFFISGTTPVEDRERVRAIVEKEDNAIIIASEGVFSVGINIRNLHNIIMTNPRKSKIRVLQTIGRELRLSHRDSAFYDLVDDLSDGVRHWSKRNYSLLHGIERAKLYADQKFNCKVFEVEI